MAEQIADSAENSPPASTIAWMRFAERLRQREVPGFARREAQQQGEFDLATEFYAQYVFTDAEWESCSREEEEEESEAF